MSIEKKGESLLDFIVANSDAEFISDLREEKTAIPSVLFALASIDPNDYSLDEWNRTYSYMFSDGKVFACRTTARAQMIVEARRKCETEQE